MQKERTFNVLGFLKLRFERNGNDAIYIMHVKQCSLICILALPTKKIKIINSYYKDMTV